MALQEFDFTLPSSGKTVKWRPLRVGTSLQIAQTFPNSNQAGHRQAALLAARIIKFDGQDKPNGMPFGEIIAWEDELDLEAFAEHVSTEESMRAMVLKKRGAGAKVDAKAAFGESLIELQQSADRMQAAISTMLQAADVMRMEIDPLGSGLSST